ncbi:PQQ-binding-like beta-propeller repeat protein [Phenylobacterium sp.]|jgi:polyvinyl alcohol dehydrogenase (cytochrome)|uniref:outer membrane protein assembly factor BamB family protein n=1 Tax=Phenylobacterium sp. TaxID=1871053 RepID=UPI002F923BEC
MGSKLWAAALAVVALVALGASAPEPDSNGVMGHLTGEAGDPKLGAVLYAARCASCHDNPVERTPSKAQLSGHTRAFIAQTMFQGVMRPMAQGLKPQEISAIAAHLSNRTGGRPLAEEAPLCRARPPMHLDGPSWADWGNGVTHGRYQPNPGFAAADVPRLKLKWAFALSGGRNGQPTLAGGRIFVSSFSGAVYALDAKTGCAYWRFDTKAGARSTVAVARLAGAKPRYAAFVTDFARITYAIDAETGKLIWQRQVDEQREVQMTGSPIVAEGKLFVPVSSAEEAIATDDAYECCKFRGALVALDAATGRVLWKTYMAPPAKPFRKNAKGVQMYGPAGSAIWSAPTYDSKRRLIYVATGDSYTEAPLDTSDAIVALDARTGAIRWKNQLTANDNYIIGCGREQRAANCPEEVGPDHDFGASPILHTLASGKQVLLAGQKSSQVYALDPDANGRLIWERRLSSGGALGGIEFGMADDGEVLYVPVADVYPTPPGPPKPGLSAIRVADGALLWTTPTPKLPCAWKGNYCSPAMSQAVSAIPGAVFGGSMDGRFRAFDAKTGRVVWEIDTAAKPVMTVSGREAQGGVIDAAGPTIAGGHVYVLSGYQARSGVPGAVLMAFSVDGR